MTELEKNEFGYTQQEHEAIAKSVEAGIIRDYDGSRRKMADSVSTSEALVRRAKAAMNGHNE